jgi:hypothetical protein
MKFRKLRIAWSVACAVACALLIVLWVRSFWWTDGIMHLNGMREAVALSSQGGDLVFEKSSSPYLPDDKGWSVESMVVGSEFSASPVSGFVWDYDPDPDQLQLTVAVPDWFALLIIGTLVALPWIRYFKLRFSLRSLLFATTLVAVVLGLIVWLR